jgi:hypothetical protein
LLSPLRVSPRSSFRKLERHCGISKPSLNPTSEASQNKVEIPVPSKTRVNLPALPHNPPQLHHKNTATKHALSAKLLQKREIHHAEKAANN